MKKSIKLTMLLLFAATLTIVSCSKEYLYESKIVGRWECIYNSGGGGGSGFEWLFRSDGVFITYDSHDLMCGIESSYSIKDNQLMLGGGIVVYTIDELTSSSLVISSNQKTLNFSKK